jgi:hypothetical protein
LVDEPTDAEPAGEALERLQTFDLHNHDARRVARRDARLRRDVRKNLGTLVELRSRWGKDA